MKSFDDDFDIETGKRIEKTEEQKNTEYIKRYRCTGCQDSGVLHIVLGGDSIGRAKPVSRHRVVGYEYCVESTIPCDCEAGVRLAQKTAKLQNPEAAVMPPNFKGEYRRRLLDHCVFPHTWASGIFQRLCVDARRAAQQAKRATPMPLQATRDDKADIDTATRVAFPEPHRPPPLIRAVERAVRSIPPPNKIPEF